ncbi:hypothetical protein VTI74DRAFT_5534 [Chaetomium olivicolor]
MTRQFLAALALAHSASALLDGYVDVVVNVDVRVPANVAAGAVNAAAGYDGYVACLVADDRIDACYSSGVLASTAPAASAQSCICCAGTTPLAASYSACASYIANDVGQPDASTVFEAVSRLWVGCSAASGNYCAGHTAAVNGPTKTATAPAVDITVPPECSSMMTIYNSCSMEIDFSTARAREAASCLCYDRSGSFNTEFEDYARTCAVFAKTVVPQDYTVMTRLATICEDYPASTSAKPLQFTTVGTRTLSDRPVFVVPSSTSSTSLSTTQQTSNAGQSAETTSTSSGLAAPAAVPGFLAWPANLLTFFLSFFILV